jgi:hypothetical protein
MAKAIDNRRTPSKVRQGDVKVFNMFRFRLFRI